MVFEEWLTSHRADIKAQLRESYETSVRRNDPWTGSIAESHANIDAWVDGFAEYRKTLIENFLRVIASEAGRQAFLDVIEKYKVNYNVDELTCAIVNSGEPRVLVALQKSSDAP